MAICLDEYAGIAGLVTVKRLTEVVFGRVGEEGESPEEEYSNIRPNVYRIEGGMDIEEANEEMDLNLPKGEYETIAGFVLAQLGEIPEVGDQFEFKDLLFRIQTRDNFRIESITIRKKIPSTETPIPKSGPIENGAVNDDSSDSIKTRGN